MGLFDKIKKLNIFSGLFSIDEDFFEELEEALILSDMGVDTSTEAVDTLRERVKANKIKDPEEVKACLREILVETLDVGDPALDLTEKPAVLLMIGVNGVGKTTTIGKLSSQLHKEGKKVLLAASDTFRAAASEQLTIWAERTGADIVKHAEGADPAAVAFDAVSAAKARGADIVLIDTAGRLQTKVNLMEELKKISRVVKKVVPDAPHQTLLVLDATTGQNAVSQAKSFGEIVPLTGVVLTKLDGTAKGGVVLSITEELHVPVKYIGLGEREDDLQKFNPDEFARALFETEDHVLEQSTKI